MDERHRVHYERVPTHGARGFVMPRDVIKALGGGDVGKAHAVLSDMFGTHPLGNQPGAIPVYVVQAVGEGSIKHGRKILKRFVKLARNSQGYAQGGPTEPNRKCALCTMFERPNGCTAVKGEISPKALCDLFEVKRCHRI